jgi:hypothetical protein
MLLQLRRLLPLALPLLLILPGCLRSRVQITSEPAGAEVIWRGKPYGATPVTIPFIWYWHYDFALEKPGYETVEVLERFRTPPWFLAPFDLFMEILPIPIPDNRERHYVLKPRPAGETSLLAAADAAAATTSTTQLTLPTTNATPNSVLP